MYRQYEDPYQIERLIEAAEIEMQEAIAMDDEDRQISIAEELTELKDRLNFAWQDDEYDECDY